MADSPPACPRTLLGRGPNRSDALYDYRNTFEKENVRTFRALFGAMLILNGTPHPLF